LAEIALLERVVRTPPRHRGDPLSFFAVSEQPFKAVLEPILRSRAKCCGLSRRVLSTSEDLKLP
jgi:hypothetical protein